MPPVNFDGAMDEAALEEQLIEMRRALMRAQAQLRSKTAKVADLVAATHEAAYGAMSAAGPMPAIPKVAQDRRQKGVEVALWDMGDWQGSKRTVSYNSQVMEERVNRFCDKAIKITEIQRADHPVKDCTIVFGGDMVEGLFNFPTQPFEIDMTLFDQYVNVSRLLVHVTRRALATYEKVTVVPEWGNHGRIGSKRDAVPLSDNIDRMCFELARQLLSDEPRLTWQECPETIQRLEIGNYRALVIHGDEVGRNGFASPATIVRHCDRWGSGAYPWEFTDVYCHHYHSPQAFSLANGGRVFMCGSTESDNRYARDTMAATSVPSQRLHFIDPERGRVTAEYVVWVD